MNTLPRDLSYARRFVNIIIFVFLTILSNLYAQNMVNPPYRLSNASWEKLHSPPSLKLSGLQPYLTAEETVVNGSFETGDLSDWTYQDLENPFFTLQVNEQGITSWMDFFVSEPTDGQYALLHGFDGAGPGYITLSQDIVLDSAATVLHFDYRAAWDLLNYGATLPRSFVVNILPGGGGDVIQSDTILVADPFDNPLVEDTGNLHVMVFLNSLPDTAFRLVFEWYIPENFSGPAFFQLDNVFVQDVAEGPELYAMPDEIDFDHVLVDDTSKAHEIRIYNIGTEDLTVNSITIADPQFSILDPPDLPLTLSVGESEVLDIFFIPTDSGQVNSTLTITSDDANSPFVEIALTGHGMRITAADPGICYATTGNADGGRLLTIAPSTGAGLLVGDIGQNAVPAIAINSEGYIYGLDGNSGDIYYIDATTGISFLSVNTGIEGLTAIAFDRNDVLYGYSQYDNGLYTIDLQTGLSIFIGNTYLNLRGLAFHPITGILFASGHFELFTLDVIDGTSSLVGSTQLEMALTDISFDIAGNLFATEGGANEDNYLVSLNQLTGEGTRIGQIGFRSVSGLEFYNIPLEGRHISISPEIIDFGPIETGDTTSVLDISISNVGTEVLTVTDISSADTDIILSDLPVLPIVLPSRTSQTFGVRVAISDTGDFNKTISISSDDPDIPVSEVHLFGRAINIQTAEKGRCYASTGNIDGGRFIQIDPSNGTGTLLGETGLDAVPSLAINSEGKIYGLDENTGDVYRIDAATGIAISAIHTDIDGLKAIAFDTSDVFYGFSDWSSALYKIDLESGLSTYIGYVGYGLRGLAFHPLTNTLWGTSWNELITINPSDGSATWIGSSNLDYPLTDIDFDIAGNLFATAGGGTNEDNYFFLIDQSTAQGTLIGEIGFQSVSGMAFNNTPIEGRHISVSPQMIDFSTIGLGDTSATKLVTISNVGTDVLTISGISESDTTVILDNLPVLPIILPSRSSQSFEVSFSASDTGIFNKSISISSDDPDIPVVDVSITCHVIIVQPAENGHCYASTGHVDGGRFIEIDLANGTGSLIGETGLDAMPAIAINSKGEIFGLDEASGDIYRIDAVTGFALDRLETNIEGLNSIAFDTSNVLYGFSSWTSRLYSLDLQTGLSNEIGYIGYSIRGIAFHPLDNTLWGSDTYNILKISTSDASQTWVGYTELNYPVTDLGFDIAGNLYATAGGGWNNQNYLVAIDQTTALGTIIGEIGFQSVSGLSFYNSPLEGRHLSVLPDTLDMGIIEVQDTSSVKVTSISNIGTEVLTISDISGSDSTVVLSNLPTLPLLLQSRESYYLDVRISISDTGIFNKTVSVSSNDLDNPLSTVIITGRAVIIAPADSGQWYASTGHNDGGRLLSLDPATGAGALIGSTGLDAVPAIAINSEGKIYGVDEGSGMLYRLDGQSGKSYEIFNTHLSHITGLAFDKDGLLYAYSEGTSSLHSIDLKRGLINLVGYLGSGFRGLSFNPIDNSLWACGRYDIYTINTEDGVASHVGFTELGVPITDIQFNVLGNLYASAGGNTGLNSLASIDKSSGAGTLIGDIGFQTVSGLAFYNIPLEGRHISVSPSSLDFGETVLNDTSAPRTLVIGNIGTDDLTVESMTLSDTTIVFSEMLTFPLILSSMEFLEMDVSIIPADTGLYEEAITLSTNDPENETVNITLNADVFSISPADSGVLYATTGHRDGGRLLKIDLATGQGSLIGPTGLPAVPGLAVNSDGEIYGVDPWEGNLYRIDSQSGKTILVGPTNVARMIAIAFDRDDRLYGYSDNFGSLYEIDPNSASTQVINEIGLEYRGIAFNPVDNSLWASSWNLLYIIDPSDGTSQIVASTGLNSGISALTFDILGNLYGSVHLEWDSSELFMFNPKSKKIKMVGEIGFESVSGLALHHVPKPGSHLYTLQNSLNFGLTAVGDTAVSKSVTLYNIGTDDLIINDISVEGSSFILGDVSSLPWTVTPDDSGMFEVAFAPSKMGIDTSTIAISSNDSEIPVHSIHLEGEGSHFTLDGLLSESAYIPIASKLNNNSFFITDIDVTNIYYSSDENYFLLGIECQVQNTPNDYNDKPDGLGIFLNFSSETGIYAGNPLAYWEEHDFHFLNGGSEKWEGGMEFTADFEVDYLFAVYSDGSPDHIFLDASTFVWDNPQHIQYIGSSNQSGSSELGPVTDGVFGENTIQFAFQGSTGAGSKKGIEIVIPLSEINAEPSDNFQVFAAIVGATGWFSHVTVPGNVTSDHPGHNPDFYNNQVSDICDCPNPGTTIGNGPYHTDWITITGIENAEKKIPKEYALSQNYPNPFNPLTTIEYQLPELAEIELSIYNILGQKIHTLIDGKMEAGYHSKVWNAKDQHGNSVATGMYIYRLDAKGISGRKFVQVKKMVVLK